MKVFNPESLSDSPVLPVEFRDYPLSQELKFPTHVVSALFIVVQILIIMLLPIKTLLSQQEGAFRYSDGTIQDYNPHLFELSGSRCLLVKHARFNWDSSWVSMTWLNPEWEIMEQKTSKLTVLLTFLMDAIRLDDGFVMCGVMPSGGGARFILKTDTTGATVGIDHPELPGNENIHSLINRGNNEFTAYSSSPMMYTKNYRLNGNLSGSSYSTQRIDAPSGYSYRMYSAIQLEPGKDLLGGAISPQNGSGDDNFLMKMDASGTIWVKSYDFSNFQNEYITSIALLSNGNYVFTSYGYLSGVNEVSGFICVTDNNGNYDWSKKITIAGGVVSLYSCIETVSGDILVCGNTGEYNGMLMKFTGTGDLIWKKYFPNTNGIIIPGAMKMNSNGKIALAGYIGGDSFIWQLDGEGNGCGFIPDNISIESEIVPTVLAEPAFSITSFNPSISPGTSSVRNLVPVKTDLCLVTEYQEHLFSEEITVYPNPASDQITMEMPIPDANFTSVTIADVNGKIQLYNAFHVQQGMVVIPVKQFKPGIYFLTVDIGNNTFNQKVMIFR